MTVTYQTMNLKSIFKRKAVVKLKDSTNAQEKELIRKISTVGLLRLKLTAKSKFKVVDNVTYDPPVTTFELVDYPGHVMRARGLDLIGEKKRDDEAFVDSISFFKMPDLWFDGYMAFESTKNAGHYIRLHGHELILARYNGTRDFKEECSFKMTTSGNTLGGECNFQNDWVDEGDGIGLRLESDSSETNQKDPKDSKLLMVPVVPDYSDVRLPGLSSILGPERKQTVYRKDSEDHRRKKLVTFNKKKIVYEDNSHEWTTQKFYNNAFENSPLSSVKELHETENGPFLKKLEARNSNASLSDSFSVADSTENRTESSLLEYDGIQETFSDESSVQIHGNPNHRPNGNVCNGKRSPLSGVDDLSYRTASTLNNGKTVVKYTKSVNRGRNGISHQNGSCNSKTVNSSSSSLERIDIERAHNVGMGSSHGKKNGGMRRISLFEDQNSLAMNHNRARSHSMKNSVHFGVPYIHNINNDDFDSETNRNSMTRRDNSRQTCVRRVPPRTYSMNTTETEGSVSDDDKSCHAPSRPRELYSGQEARSIYRGQESRPTSRSSYDSDCESVNDSVNESHKSHGSAYPRIIIEGDSDTEENCATIGSLSNGLREKRPQRTRGERQMPETLLRTNYIMNELGVENDTIMCSPHIDANVTERLPSTSEDDNVFLDNPTNRQDDFIAPNDVILYCLPDEPQTPNQGNRNFNLSVDQWLSSERERADSGFPMSAMSPHHSDLVIKKMSRKAFNLGESPALR